MGPAVSVGNYFRGGIPYFGLNIWMKNTITAQACRETIEIQEE